jgi:signal transduction histidine kinase
MTDPVDSAVAVFLHRFSRRNAAPRFSTPLWAAVRAQWQIPVAVLFAAAFTIASHAFPVTMSSRSGETMVDTIAGLISALAAFVFVERLRPTRQRRDLLIALLLGIFSAGNLLLAARPTLSDAHPLPSYMQIGATLLAVSAAVSLTRHSARTGDGLERSLAAGVAVLAVAHFNYLLVPSMSSDRLYAGDMLKLGAFLLVFYGCVIELRTLQRALVQRVAVDERRRMARDMHDGLAQELVFIATHSQRLGRTDDDAATVVHLQAAAERALHDSRMTIAVLTSAEQAPLDLLITSTVETLRLRFGIEVDLDLEHDVIVDAERRNALLRILHEASINAIRHGLARRILVRLRGGPDGPSLRIDDDGSGFDVQAAVSAGRGMGLTSMQERAETLGGSLSITSSPAGTIVEVRLS